MSPERARRLALVGPGAAMGDVVDPDREVLDAALRRAGVEASWVAWDDGAVDWAGFAAAWIRGTWDYTDRHQEFLAWADHVDAVSRLWNPAPVVRWNSHKSYLLDFAAQGVPIVPSELVTDGGAEAVVAAAQARGWTDVVVKPAVSAGAKGTIRLTIGSAGSAAAGAADAERAAVAEATAYGDVLVQPYLAEIATGETSIMVIDGRPTHAVRKIPAPGDFRVQFHHGGTDVPHEPTPAELDLAEAAMAAAGGNLLYGRVDMVTREGAGPQLMELELIEPYLFLAVAPPGVAEQVGAAVEKRIRAPWEGQ